LYVLHGVLKNFLYSPIRKLPLHLIFLWVQSPLPLRILAILVYAIFAIYGKPSVLGREQSHGGLIRRRK
jgi:hypothetical protein